MSCFLTLDPLQGFWETLVDEEGEEAFCDVDPRGAIFPTMCAARGAERDPTFATYDGRECVKGPDRRDLQGMGVRHSREGAYAGIAIREISPGAYVPFGQEVVCRRQQAQLVHQICRLRAEM